MDPWVLTTRTPIQETSPESSHAHESHGAPVHARGERGRGTAGGPIGLSASWGVSACLEDLRASWGVARTAGRSKNFDPPQKDHADAQGHLFLVFFLGSPVPGDPKWRLLMQVGARIFVFRVPSVGMLCPCLKHKAHTETGGNGNDVKDRYRVPLFQEHAVIRAIRHRLICMYFLHCCQSARVYQWVKDKRTIPRNIANTHSNTPEDIRRHTASSTSPHQNMFLLGLSK